MLGPLTTIDPDAFHEMALFREALRTGRVPTEDVFAYTPTVSPCVHHEWATGLVLYATAMTAGAAGIMALKYLLVAAICGCCLLCACWRGASLANLSVCSLLAVSLARIGFTTIRAQVFTLLALALLLLLLDQDRQGKRRWVLVWVPVYWAWLNLHGGFVVGLGILGLHWFEQVIRQRTPQWHLIVTGMVLLLVLPLNPYGLTYLPYLWRAVRMPRPQITEWAALWEDPDPAQLLAYGASVLILAYCLLRVGPRRMPGFLIVLACGVLALRHVRHLSLYAVAWWCYTPGFFQQTPVGGSLTVFWERQRHFVLTLLLALTVLCLLVAWPRKPWELSVPTTAGGPTADKILYPAGAVRYLREQGFQGNLMTPFVEGAYVSWELGPAVKVSLDSRFEVAYQPGLLEEQTAFYLAEEGWQQTLARYPTDAVLVRRTAVVAPKLRELQSWTCVYQDDAYAIVARSELHLPVVDRSGEPIPSTFP
jgi:hypothetical protein